MHAFNQLAKDLFERWDQFVIGQYTAPPCPPPPLLERLLQTANYAAGVPEEARYPRFNLAVVKAGGAGERLWRFGEPRAFNVGELRRLIPATDPRKSAVCIEWQPPDTASIVGIEDLGTTWQRAKEGLAYTYNAPNSLFIEVERPNKLAVYQRQFRVATFADGACDVRAEPTLHTFLHRAAHGGLAALDDRITPPEDESAREYRDFEFLAMWNCYAALANLISGRGHGGALIILASPAEVSTPLLRRKYALSDTKLSDAFVAFLNARHRTANEYWRRENGEEIADERLALLEWGLRHAHENLVESTRLVAQLAQCDGALVVSRSLEVLGFGTEIAAELRDAVTVKEVVHELREEYRVLDAEQFGMRHRSAVKLASQLRDAMVLVVSQDGPISAVWHDQASVYVYKGVRLVNPNTPLA